MNPQKRREIFRRFRAANPNPTTELKYRTPYELLVAVVLSAQATDKSVNQASAVLFEKCNTPQKMVDLGVAGLERYIKTIGLYRMKAKNVVAGHCRLTLEWRRPETHHAVPARRVDQPEIRVELLAGALVGHLERVVEQRLDRHVAYLLALW